MSAGIRTRGQLQEAMADEFAWRKKDLHGLKTLVLENKGTPKRDLCVRAAIALLYAHWEGFVKQVGLAYLEFVARQSIENGELQINFLAMAIAKLVRAALGSSKIQPSLDIVNFFQSQMTAKSRINWKNGVDTKSNLKSAMFKEISLWLGLDYPRFATKEKLIDEKLLANRNRIAHGQFSVIDLEEYLTLHDEVHAMMQDFYNQIDNLAFTRAYRKTLPAASQ
jgi:hypothetical protein